jgi:pyruvate dehydrogenase E2 component (dihydrolipoamide acetyltransferase)
MSGGCITISSLGHIGGTAFTPIINAPELAILGVVRTQLQPVPGPDGSISWRQMLPLSLSYDHRVINGADAARFTRFIADQLDSEAIFS